MRYSKKTEIKSKCISLVSVHTTNPYLPVYTITVHGHAMWPLTGVCLRNNPFLPVVCGPIYHGLEFRSEIIRSRRRRRSDLIISLLNDKPWYIGPQTTGKNGLFRFYHDFFHSTLSYHFVYLRYGFQTRAIFSRIKYFAVLIYAYGNKIFQ